MGQALYRKYRSKQLDDIVGQSHVTDVLARAVGKGQIAHAYLLTGPRGIGKTSIARILAHEITQLPYDGSEHLDIVEIDAASNNGVEDIRDLRDKVRIAPVESAKKVYIVDEVHMLSKAAFNALLKTLEEPPAHIVFILATTDPEKLPPTVISRTQRFSLRRVSLEDAKRHLAYIAKQEAITINDEALTLLAEYGDGSFRDSINLLDQLSDLQDSQTITVEDIRTHLGIASEELVSSVITAHQQQDLPEIIAQLRVLEEQGVSPRLFARQLLQAIHRVIAQQPALLPLLDRLVAVETSRRPDITLLTALASGMQAAAAPVTRPAPKPAPAEPVAPKTQAVATHAPPSVAMPAPSAQKPSKASKPSKSQSEKESMPTPAPAQSEPGDDGTSLVNEPGPKKDFPWAELRKAAKKQAMGLYDLLGKSGYSYDGQTLLVYTGKKLYKNKLDTTRYRAMIQACCQELEVAVETLTISADAPPIDDPGLASVAEIMGGGELVDIT